jgi:hypothetical protein
MESAVTEQLLPLDLQERAVVFGKGKHKTTHIFRRIREKDCEGFNSRVEIELELKDGKTGRIIDSQGACVWLYEAAILRVEGYVCGDGRPLCELANWRERIPHDHAIRAANLLTSVSFERPEFGCVISSEGDLVVLEALWTAAESVTGMQKYSGLNHYFASPSSDQRRRFTRAQGRALTVGDRRFGRTIIPTSQPLLTALYDELIQRVDGYSAGGRPLEGRDEVIREMDPFHKVAAARGLFQAGIDEDEGEGAE